jgi:Zn-dependent peptidase ImmA (M78 family)
LAQVYSRSVEFFMAEGPVPSETVLWREKPEKGAEEVEVKFLRLCQQYHNLEVWTKEKISVSLPEADTDKDRFGYPQAEELAKSFRGRFPLGGYPAHALLNVIEPSGTAASTLSDTFGPAILLNSQNCRWRRNHDLAHELFHLLTWRLFRQSSQSHSGNPKPSSREESLATCFARHLLMPAESLRSAINGRMKENKVKFEDLFDVAREFDVSIESLLWHMHFLYGRSSDQVEKTKEEIARAKTLAPLFEDRTQVPAPDRPARFHALAVRALRRGEISVGRCAEYLGINRQQAMKYIEQEATGNEEIQVAPA